MNRLTLMLILSAASLMLLGTACLYSSSTWQPGLGRVNDHLVWIAAGTLCCAAATFLPYAWLRRGHAPTWLLLLACGLLAATLVPGIGIVRFGAARWLPFGQPSELAKIALVLFLADYSTRNQPRMRETTTGFLRPALAAGVLGLLIFLEPDWGTAMLLATVTLGMLAVAGAHWACLISSVVIGIELFALLLLNNALRMQRFLAFLEPEKYRDGVGWQGWHSVLALGSGGVFGTFLGAGSHKNGFVPAQQTDFIVSLLGEELGFAGTAVALALFMVLVICGARIAWKIADPFGQLLAFGLTLLIGLQAFINFGVVTSALPNKGISLPFVSYGGSGMLSMLTALGLLLSIARHGPLPARNPASQPAAPQPLHRPIHSAVSLLNSTVAPRPTNLWQTLLRTARATLRRRIPATPIHPYQKPPRVFPGPKTSRV